MDEPEIERSSYVLLSPTRGFRPIDCRGHMEEILEAYGFHEEIAQAEESGRPCITYSDGDTAIFVSYGNRDYILRHVPIKELPGDIEKSVLVHRVSGPEYLFDAIVRDFNHGRDLEVDEEEIEENEKIE